MLLTNWKCFWMAFEITWKVLKISHHVVLVYLSFMPSLQLTKDLHKRLSLQGLKFVLFAVWWKHFGIIPNSCSLKISLKIENVDQIFLFFVHRIEYFDSFFRLSHTFRLVPNFHWIIVEDSKNPTNLIANLLKNSMLNFTHLISPTPASWKRKLRVSSWCLQ